MIDVTILTERIKSLNVEKERRKILLNWVQITAKELEDPE